MISKKVQDWALEAISKGLSIIVTDEKKRPTKIWKEFQGRIADADELLKQMADADAKKIGLVCGKISGSVEAIDVDLKYDITGSLLNDLKKTISEYHPTLLKRLTVQKTVNKGYHFIYRCSQIQGNKKLAQRPAVGKEITENDKIKVLIETKGEGGFIVCAPSDGYEVVQGSFFDIPEITPEERNILITVASEFNEVFQQYEPIYKEKKNTIGSSPFEDYNSRGDVIGLLEKHGWTVKGKKGKKTLLLRPGTSEAAHSGNFDEEKNWFSVFSTSTEFEAQKAYLPYAVYAFLEHKGDFRAASQALYQLGYGDRLERSLEAKTPSRIDTLSKTSHLITEEDYMPQLEKLRNGTFELGKTTGFSELDKYFRFKDGNMVVVNGHDNVGKTVVIAFLAMLSSLLHNWKWLIFSSENSAWGLVRRLIEFYWCKKTVDMSQKEYEEALMYVKAHFHLIRSDDDLYNYMDLINIAKIESEHTHYNAMLIDPYNSLKISLTNSSKLSTHEYHYEAISELKLFGKRTNLAIYINCHAVTNALRQKGSDGLASPPQKADTEGGGKFANKADDFLTIHRKVQSASDWKIAEIHVRKIKEIETGGRVTPYDDPFKIHMLDGSIGYEYVYENGKRENPILTYHAKRFGVDLNGTINKEFEF